MIGFELIIFRRNFHVTKIRSYIHLSLILDYTNINMGAHVYVGIFMWLF